MKIVHTPEVKEYLNNLVTILYEKGFLILVLYFKVPN